MKTEIIDLLKVRLNDHNPRSISDEKFNALLISILVFPKMLSLRPVVVDDNMEALGGNMRSRALTAIAKMTDTELTDKLADNRKYNALTSVEQESLLEHWSAFRAKPTIEIIRAENLTEDEQKEFIIKDNVGFGEWDYDMLANEWDADDLTDWGMDLWKNEDNEGAGKGDEGAAGSLVDKFIVPPFSVLDTRKGYWQSRKKLWRNIIGDNGESRKDTNICSPEIKFKDLYQSSQVRRKELGITFQQYLDKYVSDEVKNREGSKVLSAGVSLLDPVMAELVCLWFGLEGCNMFDPFAGDSIFGYVSAKLGHTFTGIELRPEQAQLNNDRVEGMTAKYINDDGQNVLTHIEPLSQDLLFSCPPYFDLEVYSDLENDASNQGTHEDFLVILKNAFKGALSCLKDNRFAVIVIGDVRDKKTGLYYNFIDDMKHIFKDYGAALYNELILVETGASTALRAGRNMDSRKVAKMHQNILVFYKGDTTKIKDHYKKIEYDSEDLESFRVDFSDGTDED